MIMRTRKILFIELLRTILVFSNEQPDQNPRNRVKLMYNTQMMSNDYVNFSPGLPKGDQIIQFERFLAKTEVFIDKSLFIHHIHKFYVGSGDPVVVSAPSRWGKSTLIAMLKFFYMVELDKDYKPVVDITTTNAYKFFNNGEITYDSKTYSFDSPPLLSGIEYDELCKEYLGKHPILVISFSSLCTTKCDIRNSLKRILRETLNTLGYNKVIGHFCSIQKNIYGKSKVSEAKMLCRSYDSYFNEDIHNHFIIEVIVNILYQYFENWVVLIIDEVDQYPKGVYETEGLSEVERYEYIRFYIEILQPVTKGNSDILYTLMVGVFPFRFENSAIRPHFTSYFTEKIFPFFGLLDNLANDLFKKGNLSTERQKQMNDSYNHYRSPDYMDISLYNPYSVLRNLHTTCENPWATVNRQIEFIQKVIENNINVRNDLLLLLQGECLRIHYNKYKSYVPDMSAFMEVDARTRGERFHTDFEYHLWHVGYVTIANAEKYYNDKYKKDSELRLKEPNEPIKRPLLLSTFCLHIPNNEAREVFEELLHIPKKLQMEAITLFDGIINNHSPTVSEFGKVFESILNSIPKTVMHGSETYYHSLLLHEIIEKFSRLRGYKFKEIDHRMKADQIEQPDIVIHNNHSGVLIDVKFNINDTKFDEFFNLQLCSYGIKFHQVYPSVDRLRLICFRVCENEDGTTSVKIKEYKPLTSPEDFNNLETLCNKNKLIYASKPKRSSRNPDTR